MITVDIELTDQERHFVIDCIRFATGMENKMMFQKQFGVLDKSIDEDALEERLLDA